MPTIGASLTKGGHIMRDDPYGIDRPWAVRARLIREDQGLSDPKWTLWLLPVHDDTEHRLEWVGPDDPSEIYGKGAGVVLDFYRKVLGTVYNLTITDDPYEWLLSPKSD